MNVAAKKRGSYGARLVNPRHKERLAAEFGSVIDVYVQIANAEEQSARTGDVENVDGLARSLCVKAARGAQNERRLSREHLAGERARYALLWSRLLGLVARDRPGPRQLANEPETLAGAGYPGLLPVVAELRRLGDSWPVG